MTENLESENLESEILLDRNSNLYIFQCPYCEHFIQVERGAVACSIFRHLYYFVKNGESIELTAQVDPHASKEMCEALLREGKVFGCGKPFKMNEVRREPDGVPVYIVVKCDYI